MPGEQRAIVNSPHHQGVSNEVFALRPCVAGAVLAAGAVILQVCLCLRPSLPASVCACPCVCVLVLVCVRAHAYASMRASMVGYVFDEVGYVHDSLERNGRETRQREE